MKFASSLHNIDVNLTSNWPQIDLEFHQIDVKSTSTWLQIHFKLTSNWFQVHRIDLNLAWNELQIDFRLTSTWPQIDLKLTSNWRHIDFTSNQRQIDFKLTWNRLQIDLKLTSMTSNPPQIDFKLTSNWPQIAARSTLRYHGLFLCRILIFFYLDPTCFWNHFKFLSLALGILDMPGLKSKEGRSGALRFSYFSTEVSYFTTEVSYFTGWPRWRSSNPESTSRCSLLVTNVSVGGMRASASTLVGSLYWVLSCRAT